MALGGRACSMRCQGRGGEVGAEGRRDALYAAEGGRAQCVMVGAWASGRCAVGLGWALKTKAPALRGRRGLAVRGLLFSLRALTFALTQLRLDPWR